MSSTDAQNAEDLVCAMEGQLRRAGLLLRGSCIILRAKALDSDLHSRFMAYYNLMKYIDLTLGYLEEWFQQYSAKEHEDQCDAMVEMEYLLDEAHNAATALHRTTQRAGPDEYTYTCLAAATESVLWSLSGYLFNLADGTGVSTKAFAEKRPADGIREDAS